jgi:hypothetical protein
MKLTARGGTITAGIALACSGILLQAAALASAGSPAAPPQQRQLAVTTLSTFKVVLTATRLPGTGPAPMATVTAAGYRDTAHGWKLIATKQISESFWYSVGVCSFAVTQSRPSATGSPSMVPWDSVTVGLSVDPAIGCVPPITRVWG